MALFLSTYHNKIDKKGRVSIPSQFRSALNQDKFEGVVLYPAVTRQCLTGCSLSHIERLSNAIDSLDPLSEERDAFATVILGSSHQLSFDPEGRISLPKYMMTLIDLQDEVMFLGKGSFFELWNPSLFNDYLTKAKKIAVNKSSSLKLPINQ